MDEFTPTGWQGAVQHTYTAACAGHHGPGPCPPPPPPQEVAFSGGAALRLSLGAAGGESPEH